MSHITACSKSVLGRTSHSAWVQYYSKLAHLAVLCELNLTPKPGLVDRDNSGAHNDMGFLHFCRSATTLYEWFPQFIEYGIAHIDLPNEQILSGIRPIGIACEKAMFVATDNINTHKGTIFSMGLLLTALGRLFAKKIPITAEQLCMTVAAFCKDLVKNELQCNNMRDSTGKKIYLAYALTGARGAAESGFSHVLLEVLPAYLTILEQTNNSEAALHQALLHLMAKNCDTNVVSRGGLPALEWLQKSATGLLLSGGVLQNGYYSKLAQFDMDCIARNLSPGGSADLLVVTQFLSHFYPQSPNATAKNLL